MNSELEQIKQNIRKVRDQIDQAAKKSGRGIDDITMVAVTKTVDPLRISYAVEQGIHHLGENRVQEMIEKYDILDKKCNWHLIGHLQTNKVKYIIDKVALIHSLDRMELALEIQKRAEKINRIVEVLVQVNIAEEESKSGVRKEEALELIEKVSKFGNIRIRGLMTIAPLTENPETVRWVFRELAKLRIDINRENIDNIDMDYLSMGMSNDFEVAIEEGANIVRIGTAIFGRRHYIQ